MEKKRKKEKKKRKNENPAYLDIFRVISFRDEVFVQKFLHENIITQEYYIHKSIIFIIYNIILNRGERKGRKKPKLNTFSRDNSIGKMSLPSVLTRFRTLEGRRN